jgi:hypothetical protein
MIWVREATRLLLAAWLGASVLFAAVVAPAAFAVLPSRALAGLVVGRVLPVLFWSGALLGVAGLVMEQWYARPRRVLPRVLAAILAVACVVAQLVIGRWIEALRVRIGPSLDALAPSDPLRVAFGELHAASVGLLGIAMLATLALIAIGARASRRRLAVDVGQD